jgi:phenylalanyl-tRNA synthetase alpha chain
VLQRGSPEFHFYSALPETGGSTEQELLAPAGPLTADQLKNGKKNAMQKRWCAFDKATKSFTRKAGGAETPVQDVTQAQLAHVAATAGVEDGFDSEAWPERKPGETYKALKKRKFVTLVTTTSFACARGPNYARTFVKPVADLTMEMLKAKTWQSANFKSYNFNSLGAPVGGGALHPLMKVRSEFRQVLLQMGFEEMPTNRYVESSFWNFDALFQPQQHPARDAHDTFFLKQPAAALKIPADYMATVKDTHQTGGPVKGSIGYRYDWKEEEARKNVLRTHTTAISSQMLYRLGQVSFGRFEEAGGEGGGAGGRDGGGDVSACFLCVLALLSSCFSFFLFSSSSRGQSFCCCCWCGTLCANHPQLTHTFRTPPPLPPRSLCHRPSTGLQIRQTLHTEKIFQRRPRVPQRDDGRDPLGRVPPGRGPRGRPRARHR